MQYAIQGLGFKPENIILFAWSIGGYAATWAAMIYPEVKHVVCCKTFFITECVHLRGAVVGNTLAQTIWIHFRRPYKVE